MGHHDRPNTARADRHAHVTRKLRAIFALEAATKAVEHEKSTESWDRLQVVAKELTDILIAEMEKEPTRG